MGINGSKPVEGQGHPEFYYKGAEAAAEGRYQLSETYFQQAMRSHPGRTFWIDLTNAVWGKDAEKEDTPFSKDYPEEEYDDDDGEVVFTNDAAPSDTVGGGGTNPLEPDSDKPQETKSKNSSGNSKGKGSAAAAAGSRKKYIYMPFDTRLEGIMDYTRMVCDIANCYLSRPKDEVNQSIAMVYYGFLNSHFQLFFYTLKIWMAENEEIVGEMMTSNTDSGKRVKAHSNEIISPGECMWVVEMIYGFLRYYWIQTVFNLMALSLVAQRSLDSTEVKRFTRITENIIELGGSAQYDLNFISSLFMHSECGKVLQENMPSIGYDFHADEEIKAKGTIKGGDDDEDPSAGGGSSGVKSSVSSTFFAGVIGNKIGQQNFLTLSHSFSAVQSVTLDLNQDLPIRLSVDTQILRKNIAVLEHPAQRQAYYYINWFLVQNAFVVPGHNSYYLRQHLPDYEEKLRKYLQKKGILHEGQLLERCTSSLEISNKTQASGKDFTNQNMQTNLKEITALETNILDNKSTINLIKLQGKTGRDAYSNDLLDLHDLNTTRVLELEEAFLIEMPVMIMMALVLRKAGNMDRCDQFCSMIRKSADVFYGGDSPECAFILNLLDVYGTN